MQNPTDERILEVLSTGLVLSPKIIAENIDRQRAGVNRRLNVLTEYGFLERIDRGRYEITDRGRSYLEGELDVDELEG